MSDSKFVGYLPSVIAAATMMRIIEKVETFDPLLHQTKLLNVLNITKEKVKTCYELILGIPVNSAQFDDKSYLKRKIHESPSLSSQSCVIDSNPFGSDESSNDSWSASSYNTSSSSSQKQQRPLKKMRGSQ
ncbi:unnamed protein product [Cochlearia groenlandica]